MPTLIIPDIHERLHIVEYQLQEYGKQADKVVILGDWFDTFKAYDGERVRQICRFIVTNIQTKPNWTWILGNHDSHYAFHHPSYQCSGYNPITQLIVDEMISPDIWRLFKVYTQVGPYTVSHAGFCEATLQYAKPEICEETIETGLSGGYDPIFGAGRARGGSMPFGGPLWLDWNHEFEHIDDFPQIVGHTQDTQVRSKGTEGQLKSWCCDTANKHILWVDEETGVVKIEAL